MRVSSLEVSLSCSPHFLAVGTLDLVMRILIDRSAWLVEPCALSLPVRIQQEAHRRRVRWHRSRLPSGEALCKVCLELRAPFAS